MGFAWTKKEKKKRIAHSFLHLSDCIDCCNLAWHSMGLGLAHGLYLLIHSILTKSNLLSLRPFELSILTTCCLISHHIFLLFFFVRAFSNNELLSCNSLFFENNQRYIHELCRSCVLLVGSQLVPAYYHYYNTDQRCLWIQVSRMSLSQSLQEYLHYHIIMCSGLADWSDSESAW